jgi:uncharacterized protein
MVIDVSRIIKHDGASQNVDFTGMIEEIDEVFSGYAFNKPVRFSGNIVNEKGILKLSGVIETVYDAQCGRCLSAMEIGVSMAIKEYIFADTPEDDSEAYTYAGKSVDLSRIMKDNIILNLPVRQLCSEKCKGLCPECGSNLNVAACGCKKESGDPRWEVLNKFKQ